MVLLKMLSEGKEGRANRMGLRGSDRRKIKLLVFCTLMKKAYE